MNSDEGVEFVSAWRMLEARGVQIHKSRKEEFAKNAIVERFNRTIRNVMRKYEAEYPRTGVPSMQLLKVVTPV
jgi:transposase InsO family protein